jgi:hypothetical protein
VVEPGIWRTTFAVTSEEEFDLYVVLTEDWLHFAVSPLLVTRDWRRRRACHCTLLKLNQELRMARFALDADGDVNLLADLPLSSADASTLARCSTCSSSTPTAWLRSCAAWRPIPTFIRRWLRIKISPQVTFPT